MACHSLKHHGEELLGAVRGPDVPDVPWITGSRCCTRGPTGSAGSATPSTARSSRSRRGSPDIYVEEHGLPLHGLRSAVHGWTVIDAQRHGASSPGATSPASPSSRSTIASRSRPS